MKRRKRFRLIALNKCGNGNYGGRIHMWPCAGIYIAHIVSWHLGNLTLLDAGWRARGMRGLGGRECV